MVFSSKMAIVKKVGRNEGGIDTSPISFGKESNGAAHLQKFTQPIGCGSIVLLQ
jgi:hypothetical protein